ncbi:MAG TPA: hypothetical protein VLZ10_05725 [Thermodesulfobacteriota bacterium]|nr:hypothetical protein [Thermodesulfobacteriota bacterium]
MKIDLLFKKKREKAKVRILRKGFFGLQETLFEVILQQEAENKFGLDAFQEKSGRLSYQPIQS